MVTEPVDSTSVLCLGEVMMRLDPGEGRIRSARTFNVWEGGGEYNVGRALSSVFGHRVGIVTALVDNEVGGLIENMIRYSGVDTSCLTWVPGDGLGYTSRNGLNFTERGFGLRAPLGESDRGHSAASQFVLADNQWDEIFDRYRPALFHTGGIYAALSEQSDLNLRRALAAAKRHGVSVSYDFNHRPSLWASRHTSEQIQEKTSAILNDVDIVIGGEFDLRTSLGLDIPPAHEEDLLSAETFETAARVAAERFPRLQSIISTRRRTHSSTRHDFAAIGWDRDTGLSSSRFHHDVDVYDRVGAGDAFAAGWLHGHFSHLPFDDCLNWGAASGVLAMTTPGDSLIASTAEVQRVVQGSGTAIQR